MRCILIFLCLAWMAGGAVAGDYVRGAYHFKTPPMPKTAVGAYTGDTQCALHWDHVVSLHDANHSGAQYFTPEQKRAFANDRDNLIPVCAKVNLSKGKSPPADFYRKSTDGKGVEVAWHGDRFCAYVRKYQAVKQKYNLSFENNTVAIFEKCL